MDKKIRDLQVQELKTILTMDISCLPYVPVYIKGNFCGSKIAGTGNFLERGQQKRNADKLLAIQCIFW